MADEGWASSISIAVVTGGAGVGLAEGTGVLLGAGVVEAAGLLEGKGNGFSEGKGKGLKKEIAMGTASKLVSISTGSIELI